MRIGLGTVQFGVPYGITNTAGQVPAETITAILDQARASGIRVLDTAALYGQSERALGTALAARPAERAAFDIVTKTSKSAGLATDEEATARLESTFVQSLADLGTDHVYGLLVHEADDLLGAKGPMLWHALTQLKRDGRVRKIGVSVYSAQQIDELLARYPLDLVQLPFNAVDQRLVHGGQLRRLKDHGVEVHARSAFLQGLLLLPAAQIPPRFGPLAQSVSGLHAAFAARGLLPLEGLLAAVLQQPEIDCVIVGVTSLAEFDQVLTAARQAIEAATEPIPLAPFAIANERILSPALWPSLEIQSTDTSSR